MSEPIAPPIARNERGQFLPRNDKDTPIGVVLSEAEDKRRADQETADEEAAQKPKGRENKPAKPATFRIEGAAAEFFNDMVGDGDDTPDPDKDKEAEATKNKAAEESKAKAAAEQAKKDKEAADKAKEKAAQRTPPRRAADAPTMTAEQIAQIAAEAAARVNGSKKVEDAKATEPEVSPSDQRKISTLKHMEELYGDKYKGASLRYTNAQAKLKAYAAQWEKDNPGQSFEESADAHQDFFEKNDLYEFWDADDFDEARLDIISKKRSKENDQNRDKEINAKLSKLERAEKLREKAPEIHADQVQAAKWIWKEFGGEFEKVMGETGFNKEKAAELAKADPVGYSHRLAVAKDLDVEAEETYKLFNRLIDFDPKNEIHVEMSEFADRMEQALAKAPIEDKTDSEGRTFLTADNYYKLTADKRDNHWTLQARDVIFKRAKVLAKQVTDKIKEEEDRLTKFAEAKGWKKPEPNAERTDADKNIVPNEDEEPDGKPGGPSASAASNVAAIKTGNGKDNPNSSKSFFDDI